MKGASFKLSILIFVLVAFASFLCPFTAEARHKHVHHSNCHHRRGRPDPAPTPAPVPASNEGIPPYQIHGCGYPCSDSNDCDWPCTECGVNRTCAYEEPFFPSPSPVPSPSMETPTQEPPLSPAPAPDNGIGVGVPPYQIHGCGYPCSDSNDCDWPCTVCGVNGTCAFEEPFFPSSPVPSPSIETPTQEPPLSPAPAPDNGIGVGVPPYQIHGCGYPCSDSNDCDWPCTICGADQTCTFDEPFFTSPSLAPLPLTEAPIPQWVPGNGIAAPPYQIHGCGYPCNDSNDCDAPCTVCCANYTCCYDVADPEYMLPPMSPSEPPKLLPLPPSPPPSTEDVENDDMFAPQPAYDIGTPAELPPPGYEFPPYQIHGCGYGPCMDSNDCDWPCTSCCSNHTCCYEEPMFR
ncbi:leucine-rich repeat extensin-like protein 5 [Beta vulgaris subsp. vulgaris]|uniref:leucine-rich repeat extensin-like protein 5 n=1 Tax=Beta vulgaris subsp. vulgaris TaxID=3555 RepID=UPI002036F2FD|nr:leucine-rich repeat extensin-like protein 5 [Beta vulgaris subsp. vulgaris]